MEKRISTSGYAIKFTGTTHTADGDSGGPVIHTTNNGINSLVGFQSENFAIVDEVNGVMVTTYYSATVNARTVMNALGATIYTGN